MKSEAKTYDNDELVALLYGELPAEQARSLYRKIEQDPDLKQTWTELRAVHKGLDRPVMPKANPALRASILKGVIGGGAEGASESADEEENAGAAASAAYLHAAAPNEVSSGASEDSGRARRSFVSVIREPRVMAGLAAIAAIVVAFLLVPGLVSDDGSERDAAAVAEAEGLELPFNQLALLSDVESEEAAPERAEQVVGGQLGEAGTRGAAARDTSADDAEGFVAEGPPLGEGARVGAEDLDQERADDTQQREQVALSAEADGEPVGRQLDDAMARADVAAEDADDVGAADEPAAGAGVDADTMAQERVARAAEAEEAAEPGETAGAAEERMAQAAPSVRAEPTRPSVAENELQARSEVAPERAVGEQAESQGREMRARSGRAARAAPERAAPPAPAARPTPAPSPSGDPAPGVGSDVDPAEDHALVAERERIARDEQNIRGSSLHEEQLAAALLAIADRWRGAMSTDEEQRVLRNIVTDMGTTRAAQTARQRLGE